MSASSRPRHRRPRISTALLVFIFFAAFYAFFADLEMDGYEVEPYLTAESLWMGHGLTLSTASHIGAKYHALFFQGAGRRDSLTQRHVVGSRLLTRTGFAQPVLEVPFYAIGLAIDRAAFGGGDLSRRFLDTLFNPLISAVICCLLFLYARALFRSERIALIVALVYGVATAGFAYATIGMETVQTLFLVSSLLLIYVARRSYRRPWLALAGLSAGAMLATKASAFIFLPFLLIFLALDLGTQRTLRAKVAVFAWFLAPAAAPVVLNSVPTYLLCRGFLAGAERDFFGWSLAAMPTGLYGLLLSAGKSIFLYSPPAILSVIGFAALWRQSRREAAALIALVVGVTLFVAGYARPLAFADDVCGPRYVISLTPLLILPIGALLQQARRKVALGAGLAALVASGIMVQIVGVAVSSCTVRVLRQQHLEYNESFRYVPALSHLAINWAILRSTIHRLATGDSLGFAYEPLYTGGRDPATPAPYVFDLQTLEGFRVWWLSMLTASHFPKSFTQPPAEVAAVGSRASRLFVVLDLVLLAAVGLALWRRGRGMAGDTMQTKTVTSAEPARADATAA